MYLSITYLSISLSSTYLSSFRHSLDTETNNLESQQLLPSKDLTEKERPLEV